MELSEAAAGKPMSLADTGYYTLCCIDVKSCSMEFATANSNKDSRWSMLELLCKCTCRDNRNGQVEETKDLSKELSQKIVEYCRGIQKEQVLMYGKYQRNTEHELTV